MGSSPVKIAEWLLTADSIAADVAMGVLLRGTGAEAAGDACCVWERSHWKDNLGLGVPGADVVGSKGAIVMSGRERATTGAWGEQRLNRMARAKLVASRLGEPNTVGGSECGRLSR